MAAPTATIVVADNALSVGETPLVTFTFSEAVLGFTNADLTIANGVMSPVSSADGGVTWTATFTPTANITDATNVIAVDLSGVTDSIGTPGVGTANSNNYAIDTLRPTVGIVVADPALRAGETTVVTFTFNEAVTGFTLADLTVANGTLSALSSTDGGITWTATLNPTASVTDATNVITLNNAGISDAAGNAGAGTTDSGNYAIDTLRPTVGIVVADPALMAGETTVVTFTFNEAVTGFTLGDLTVANGTLSSLSSNDGGITWTATLTPTASVNDATNVIRLDNAGISDAAGNAGTGTTDSGNYAVNTVRPTATVVVADDSLTAGETTTVTFTFSQAVFGFSNADLTVANGNLSAVASADGGITWTATLTPVAAITDSSNLITLNLAGVTNSDNNAGLGTVNSNNYAVLTAAVVAEPPPPTAIAGTSFGDFIIANDLSNTIDAGLGDDSVQGQGGDDVITGGVGNDSLHGNVGADTLNGGVGNDILLGGQGADFLQGGLDSDTLSGDLGDDTVHGGQGDDEVYGRAGDDILFGDIGNDIVRGGLGNDQVSGGLGDDFVSGDRGDDTLSGGLGADRFHFFSGAGRDVVTDFSRGEGDRIELLAGTQYTVAQVGGDTVITVAGGDQLILQGVQLASLGDGWITA